MALGPARSLWGTTRVNRKLLSIGTKPHLNLPTEVGVLVMCCIESFKAGRLRSCVKIHNIAIWIG